MSRDLLPSARRRLRSNRIHNTFGVEQSNDSEIRYRNVVLPFLAGTAANLTTRQLSNPNIVIDTAISAALSRVDESDSEYLSVLCLASQVLAVERQFARLLSIAPLFRDLADRMATDRPYLAASVEAFSLVLKNQYSNAERALTLVLGLEEDQTNRLSKVSPSSTNAVDALLAAGLRRWLIRRTTDLLQQARRLALQQGDGLLFVVIELFLTFADVASRSSSVSVIPESEPLFLEPRFRRYLNERGIRTLYPAQQAAIEHGALGEGSRVIAMPTSSGKTFLAELRIIAELTRNPGGRAIYLAPYRLLARQVEEELKSGLRRAGISVKDLGGDFDVTLDEELLSGDVPQVAIMTPERLDAILRMADEDRRGSDAAAALISSIVLLVCDEIQLVGRLGRGPRLEFFLTRLLRRLPSVPILGLAALAQGIDSLAEWLGAVPDTMPYPRPTGIIELLWKPNGAMLQRFERSTSQVFSLPRANSAIASAAMIAARVDHERMPVLIVETTRANSENVVRKIRKQSPGDGNRWRSSLSVPDRRSLDSVAEEADAILGQQNDLGRLIRDGLAYHHAGVPSHLLRLIEELVRKSAIRVVGATTTVAEGAHLPFQVVILPHMNFQGASGKLEKDLYQNIAGRAGRANVATEGIVLIIDSESKSLKGHVEKILWNDDAQYPIRGRLQNVLQPSQTISDYRTRREAMSQILAWLGDPDSYVEDQSGLLASETLSWRRLGASQKERLESQIETVFEEFEGLGLAEAASPYRLTPAGRRARLAGVGSKSCIRIARRLAQRSLSSTLQEFRDLKEIGRQAADIISLLVFESEEALEQSLWFRYRFRDSAQQLAALLDIDSDRLRYPYDDELFQVDLAMVANWLLGTDLRTLSDIPSVLPWRGAFSSDDVGERTSDAAEYVTRISYPASWAWGAVQALLGQDGDNLPNWIRSAIEPGVPSETSVELIRSMGLSREGAINVAEVLSPSWESAEEQMSGLSDVDLLDLNLTSYDHGTMVHQLGRIGAHLNL